MLTSQNQIKYLKGRLCLLLGGMIGCLIAAMSNMVVYADNFAATVSQVKFTTAIFIGLSDVYKIILIASAPVAALCIGSAAFQIWLGGERGLEKAKKIILYTIMGFAVVYLAPLVVNTAKAPLKNIGGPEGAAFIPIPDFYAKVLEIWNMAEKIMLPLAGISLAYGGVCFFGLDILSQINTERQVEKGKVVIRVTCIAIVAFYLLPAVVNFAVAEFSAVGWTPPNTTIPTVTATP